jgi:hypothetical protein
MVHLPADTVGQDNPLDTVQQRVLRRGEQVTMIRRGANRADANQHGDRAAKVNREIVGRLAVVRLRRHLRVAVKPEQVRQQVQRQRGRVRTTGVAFLGRFEQRLEAAQISAEPFLYFPVNLSHAARWTGDWKQGACQRQADNALEIAPFSTPNRRA